MEVYDVIPFQLVKLPPRTTCENDEIFDSSFRVRCLGWHRFLPPLNQAVKY